MSGSIAVDDEKSASGDGDWVPGQDVQVDYPKILEILVAFLGAPFGDKGSCPYFHTKLQSDNA